MPVHSNKAAARDPTEVLRGLILVAADGTASERARRQARVLSVSLDTPIHARWDMGHSIRDVYLRMRLGSRRARGPQEPAMVWYMELYQGTGQLVYASDESFY